MFLHLGGCEFPVGQQGAESAYQNPRVTVSPFEASLSIAFASIGLLYINCIFFVVQDLDYPGRCSDPRRAASLNRFRQKRKERCFEKKIRYNVRQEVARR